MKLYAEAVRIADMEDTEPDFVRIDLDDLPEAEAVSLIRSLMDPPYVVQRHYCYHDEDPRKPCVAEVMEVVEE